MGAPSTAQAQSAIEFNSAGASTAAAPPTTAPITVTFRNNADNPSGNTFSVVGAPAVTATVSVLNQAYANASNFTTEGVMIGGTFPGDPLYAPMNFLGGGQNGFFTSLPTVTAGTGFAVANNHGVQFEMRTRGLRNAGTSGIGRHRVADIQIDLSSPVSNLTLHFTGLGGIAGGKNFTGEFNVDFANSIGVTGISRLSGNSAFSVSGNQINNAVTVPGANCSAANSGACGSVHIQGEAVSRVYLQAFLRGGQTAAWPTNGAEGWLLSVSGETAEWL